MIGKHKNPGLVILKAAGDILMVNISFILAFLIRFGGELPTFNFQPYLSMVPFITVFSILVFNFYGLYRPGRGRWSEVRAGLIASVAIIVIFTVVISYMTAGFSFPRTVFLISIFTLLLLLGLWRRFVLKVERKRTPPLAVICVSPCDDVSGLVQKVIRGDHLITGVLTDSEVVQDNCEYPLLGTYRDAYSACIAYRPDAVIIAGDVPERVSRSLIKGSLLHGWQVFIVPGLFEIMLAQTELEQIEDLLVLKVNREGNPGRQQAKRALDIVLSLLGLVVLLPLFLLCALAIKLDSRGPVFYRQVRVSERGGQFFLYKFRTMVNHAEISTGPVLSTENDRRVTRVGRFLRSSRIDELPQLFNVLVGDMSIVGPRPERPHFVDKFKNEIPEYGYRHRTKAGITGLAQVMGRYSSSPDDKLKFDLLYARNYSPLFDLKIIFRTMKTILTRERSL